MEDVPSSPFDRKRRRDGDHSAGDGGPVDKKARPTAVQSPNSEERSWYPRDSVMGFLGPIPTERAKYDSDDQSSMVSEPGSEPALSQVSEEDVAMLSSDDDQPTMRGRPVLSRSNAERRAIAQINRAPTPVMSPKIGSSALPNHMRGRHPQEHASSDRIDVPSPIDEDEVPTPPSAEAEAAGSQLQMLSVNDVEMTTGDDLPTISVQADRSMQLDGGITPSYDPMDATVETLARKTRARSGALSAGEGSPMRESPGLDGFGSKRGFSMGYRADCIKCQQKVPGHMNHLY